MEYEAFTNRHFRPILRMGTDDGVGVFGWLPVSVLAHDRRALGVERIRRASHHLVGMHAFQARQHILHAVRQRVIGPPLAGEERVTADAWRFECIEQRAHWRLRHHGGVGVPILAYNPRVAGCACDGDDFWIMVSSIEIRVDEDIAELPGERLVLVCIQRLVSEEQHAVFG